jgi:hypothetical protein
MPATGANAGFHQAVGSRCSYAKNGTWLIGRAIPSGPCTWTSPIIIIKKVVAAAVQCAVVVVAIPIRRTANRQLIFAVMANSIDPAGPTKGRASLRLINDIAEIESLLLDGRPMLLNCIWSLHWSFLLNRDVRSDGRDPSSSSFHGNPA